MAGSRSVSFEPLFFNSASSLVKFSNSLSLEKISFKCFGIFVNVTDGKTDMEEFPSSTNGIFS